MPDKTNGSDDTARVSINVAPIAHPDCESLALKLELKKHGEEEGRNNIPPSDAPGPIADYERTIEEALGTYCTQIETKFGNLLHNQKVSIDQAAADITESDQKARRLPDDFEREAHRLLSDQDSNLKKVREGRKMAEAEYDRFRRANRLEGRAAIVPNTFSQCVKVFLLFLLIAIEGLVNTKFFGEGLEGGLIAGFVTAVVISLANTVGSFSLGRLSTNFFHVSVARKAIGGIFLLFWIVFTVTVAFSAGHYRDALQVDPDQVNALWFSAMGTHFFKLASMDSYLLLLVTLFFGIVAFVDGLAWNDRYPGYTDIAKRRQEAIDACQEVQNDLRNKLAAIFESAKKDLDTLTARTSNALGSIRSSLNLEQQFIDQYRSEMKVIDSAFSALVGQFRTANRSVRTTPAPAYYDQPVDPISSHFSTIEKQLAVDTGICSKGEGTVISLKKDKAEILREIDEKYNEAIGSL